MLLTEISIHQVLIIPIGTIVVVTNVQWHLNIIIYKPFFYGLLLIKPVFAVHCGVIMTKTNLQNLFIKASFVCDLCKKYHIEWCLNKYGITIYSSKNDHSGTWFPLTSIEKAEAFVLKIANTESISQSTLDCF